MNLKDLVKDKTQSSRNNLILWYRQPAETWTEALPIGNGRLGGMIFGGVKHERIQLNEDSLWSGGHQDADNPEALKNLNEVLHMIVQELIEEGKPIPEGPADQVEVIEVSKDTPRIAITV